MGANTVKKAEVEVARQLYIYGGGDGKRITNVKELADAANVHEQTVRNHIGRWEAEVEGMLAKTSPLALGLELSAQVRKDHHADVLFYRDQINSLKWEIDNLDNAIAKLERICENFSLNTENGDAALRLFSAYLRASTNKGTLRSQLIQLEKRWNECVGIGDLKDIQVAGAKEVAKKNALRDLQKTEAQHKAERREIAQGGGIFARPAVPVEEA